MCYKKPGPRCSAHARQSLDEALLAYSSAGLTSAEIPDEVLSRVFIAQEDYDSTPAGQDELREEIKQLGLKLLEVNGSSDTASMMRKDFCSQIVAIQRRLENGISMRKVKMDAWEQVHGYEGEGVTSFEDAMAILRRSHDPDEEAPSHDFTDDDDSGFYEEQKSAQQQKYEGIFGGEEYSWESQSKVDYENLEVFPVFVYGSLLTGMSNNVVVSPHAQSIKTAKVQGINMHANGSAYPYAVQTEDEGNQVSGEIVYLRKDAYVEAMQDLDMLEGHRGDPKQDHYDRVIVNAKDNEGNDIPVWMYVASKDDVSHITSKYPHVPDGNWRTWKSK